LDGVSETPPFGVAQQLGTALFNKPLGGVGMQLDLRQLGLHYGAASSHGVRQEDEVTATSEAAQRAVAPIDDSGPPTDERGASGPLVRRKPP
jgi:hypothetical protein